jgi:hypothetical protein
VEPHHTTPRPADIDLAELYDGFSFLTVMWLEALGFCEHGKVGEFIDGGERIALTGSLPLNTSGGQLSGGRLHGMASCTRPAFSYGARAASARPPAAPRSPWSLSAAVPSAARCYSARADRTAR